MAEASYLSQCWPAGVLFLNVLALVLVGCDEAAQDAGKDSFGFSGNRTLTDIAEVIRAFNVTVAQFSDDASSTHIRGLHIWNFHVPSLEVQPLTEPEAHSVKINVSNVFAEFQVDYLQAFGEGKLWEIVQIEGTLQGKFQAVISPTLQNKYALEFSECSVHPEVKVSHMKRNTWHTADFFGLGLIVTRKVKQVLEEQTEKIFKQKVCGLYEFTELMQRQIEHALALQHATLPPRTNLSNPYLWPESQILQWMVRFNQNANVNRFSIKSSLEPFLDGLGTSVGWCAYGTSEGCFAETPEAINSALKHKWNVTGGRQVLVAVEDLSVRLIDFTIPRVVLPTLDDSDGQLIGFDLAVGPLHFKLLGTAVIQSDAHFAQCDIRKNFSIDIHFSIISGSGCFLVQADANKYNALSAAQKATLACADEVLTNFRLDRFNPSVGLEKIDVYVSPGHDEEASTRLVQGLQKLVDGLIVTGINNAEDKINAVLATLAQNFVEQHMGKRGGLRGLFELVGHDIGECHDAAASPRATYWAFAAGMALAAAVAILVVFELRSNSSGSSIRLWGSESNSSGSSSAYSLANAPYTAARWKFSVPMFILGCVLLYIQSNTGIAAVMTAYLTSDYSPDVEVYRLTEFGVVKSILDLWNNHMRELAVLLFCFSVIFPYCKLALCLMSWLLPLPPESRGRLLCVLNTLGKWSFVDAYVLMTLMGLGSLDTQMHGGIGVAVFIDPRPAFVSFLVATVISLIVGEVILHCHELNLGEHKKPNTSGRAPSLLIHLVGFAFILFVVSSYLEICSFEIEGIIGWFLNFLKGDQNGNKFGFSLLNLGARLWNVTSDAHQIEAVFMQAIYFLSAFAMNASFLLAALSFASVVMPKRIAGHIQEMLPVLHSWSAADVFAVGVILTVQETKHGSFVYTPPWLKTQVKETLRPRIQMPGASNDIIQIVPRLEAGAWLLVLTAIIYALAGHHFLRLIRNKDLGGSEQLLSDEEDDASEDDEEYHN